MSLQWWTGHTTKVHRVAHMPLCKLLFTQPANCVHMEFRITLENIIFAHTPSQAPSLLQLSPLSAQQEQSNIDIRSNVHLPLFLRSVGCLADSFANSDTEVRVILWCLLLWPTIRLQHFYYPHLFFFFLFAYFCWHFLFVHSIVSRFVSVLAVAVTVLTSFQVIVCLFTPYSTEMWNALVLQ